MPRPPTPSAWPPWDPTAGRRVRRELTEWARPGETTHWWRRATVTVAEGVEFYDDDASGGCCAKTSFVWIR
ncbi:MAG: hypothetical protein QOE30_4916 [Mycobacterium sp.]|uniref:hypothetical protein n=1 Tax=Mycobacterium sp. TaxID=1785 RepID=UPI0028B4C059|nr:hypothetical protein [Mycobacterium sp.]MDT5119177.1 hypothetical protein [Mycobacterium sp.]